MGAHSTHTHDHTSCVPVCVSRASGPRDCSVARRSARESRFYISRFNEPYTLLAFFCPRLREVTVSAEAEYRRGYLSSLPLECPCVRTSCVPVLEPCV